jgi:acyl-coenzyme A synthetase/AMP-(fatty) acid ligase
VSKTKQHNVLTLPVGAIFSSTPAEFGVKAVVDRYSIIRPKVLFTIDRYRYAGKEHDVTERSRKVVEELRALGDELTQVVVVGHLNTIRTPANDAVKGFPSSVRVSDWHTFMGTGNDCPPKIPFYRAEFNHPIWIVFSSGTTGKPKSIYGPGGGIMLMRKLVYGIHGNLDHRDSYLQFATVSRTKVRSRIATDISLRWAGSSGTCTSCSASWAEQPSHTTARRSTRPAPCGTSLSVTACRSSARPRATSRP